jgi:hypothetical protein
VVDEGLDETPDDTGGFMHGGNYQKVPVYVIMNEAAPLMGAAGRAAAMTEALSGGVQPPNS